MPSPTTVLQLIEDALGLTNAVGTDQTLTADESTDALRVFNDLVEDWSTQNLAVWDQANQTFNTIANQGTYTIGTGGDWATTRPVHIEPVAFSTVNGATFPCVAMTQEEANLIAVPTQTQEYPTRFLYVNDYPLGLITLWPVPSAVTPVTFSINRVLAQIPAVGTTVAFPPGYAKAVKYALAVELAPVFGQKTTTYPDVMAIAAQTFANIKRANSRPRLLYVDPAYSTGSRRGWTDWRTG